MSATGSPSCGPAPDSACAMSAARPVRALCGVPGDCCGTVLAERVLTSDGFCCAPRVPLRVRCGGTGQLGSPRIWAEWVPTSDGFCCVPRVPLRVRSGGAGQLSAERIWSVVSTEPVDGVTAGGVTVDCATEDCATVDSVTVGWVTVGCVTVGWGAGSSQLSSALSLRRTAST